MKIQSDGNGGFNVSKSLTYMTLIMLILSLFGLVVSVTAFGVTNKNTIESVEYQAQHNAVEVDKNIVVLARLEPRLDNIEDDIDEIKEDVRFLVENN